MDQRTPQPLDDYEFGVIEVANAELDDAARGWLAATRFGFKQPASSPENNERWWATAQADGQRWRWARRTDRPAGLGLDEVPAATFATLVHTVNVGNANLAPALYITDVTVRATDRRKGLLRHLMTEVLSQARADGLGFASLTASEASIYGRFGFGVATHDARVEVDLGPRFQLRRPAPCRIEQADPAVIGDLVESLQRDFQARNRSAHEVMAFRKPWLSGEWDWEKMAAQPAMRAAVALDDDGTPIGAVSFELDRDTAKVHDLVGTPAAEISLWQYLASLDLVSKATYGGFGPGHPLRAALVDPRVVKVVGAGDQVWIRLLDVEQALRQRGWCADGAITLQVDDPMGLAAGCWRVEVRAGEPSVTPADADAAQPEGAIDGAAPLVRLEVDTLGELWFGAISVAELAAAGRIDGDPAAIRALTRLFAVDEPPRNVIEF